MDGILLLNKEKGITSRDLVNQVSKKLNIKKVGHAGTLDPLASGLMVVGVGKATKILDLLTVDTKEYIATVKMGIQTDTLDITGKIIKTLNDFSIANDIILNALNHFKGSYLQTVPKYSAVKINGKRLYEYARKDIEIDLPKREVNIINISLESIDIVNNEFTFKTLVSKGTYIRSLIDDIGIYLQIPCTMKSLIRTKSGKFTLKDSFLLNDEFKFINIQNALDFPIEKIIDKELLKKIKNGNSIYLNSQASFVTLIDESDLVIAIYQKDKLGKFKAYKVF